jgi:hypothetical protein
LGDGKWYARSGKKIDGKQILMHRLLLSAKPHEQVDHHDSNGLNNRRSNNIRIATSSQNAQNKGRQSNSQSKYKGVRYDMAYDRKYGAWRATICIDRKQNFLGYFSTEKAAAHAYNLAAQEHFGVFAKLNRIEDGIIDLYHLKRISGSASGLWIIRRAPNDPANDVTCPVATTVDPLREPVAARHLFHHAEHYGSTSANQSRLQGRRRKSS